ncbi:MAG: bifunctional glutamate N-acetyltransferase/amino-acid acetyltransferase ArgJ [Propionibacteriaceae bacterium]|jgi:glutamate N-acetyltransferase/amino-acid N-acetyltransferase|nr:bifunctional glutamate N-acetyltransferase/amino-acid acetyltransferase ArgJ [Propionibacteriaceae bacterium]
MSVTAAKGFLAAGVTAGIKASGKKDLALVVNKGPDFNAAAVFTSNRFPAAPVQWSRKIVAGGEVMAVLLNSGGANACTGAAGYADTEQSAHWVAEQIGVSPEQVAICSTGLIGERLPMSNIASGIATVVAELDSDGGSNAAQAIMTTDTVPKMAQWKDPAGWSVGGMAKGAGMLAPGLATMLATITTDARVGLEVLNRALRTATSLTFDRADSDGCMSTNDTVILLANGASGIAPAEADFANRLAQVCRSLARQLIGDAEGAAHDVEVRVTGAASEADALEVAREVARSNLFKCAIFGNDPNWGRVLSAVGVTQAVFDSDKVSVLFNGTPVFKDGQLGENRSQVSLDGREVVVEIQLAAGTSAASIWTNDLTYGYVKENAEYST